MKKRINTSLALSTAVCLVPFIMSLVFYGQLPEQVAIHFDSGGNPDNYAPKLFMAVGIPLIMLCAHLYSWFRLESDPLKHNASVTITHIKRWLIPFLSVIMQTALITYAIGYRADWNFYVSLCTGVIFVIIGNYLPKCKRNYTVGIKLPWTLHDEVIWNKTHRAAGFIWVFGGAVLIVNAFSAIFWLIYVVIALLVIFPLIYSYSIYKRNAFRESNN